MIYFVPTPIGNIRDITLRALDLMKSTQYVICEDPRVSHKLYKLLEIENKPKYISIIKNHELNQQLFDLIDTHGASEDILVMTDAGSPGLSDPGRDIIAYLQENGLAYAVLPGANAVIPAVVASGLVSKEFHFMGFLPLKKGRKAQIKLIAESSVPVVLYESVHRIEKLCAELTEFLPAETKIFIHREISKQYETMWHGTISDLNDLEIKLKGEFVVIIG